MVFNRRPGGGHFAPLPCFFEDNSKTNGRSVTKFCIPFHWSILHLLWNCFAWVTSGQVTRSSHVTWPPKWFMLMPQLQFLTESFSSFQNLIRPVPLVPTTCISRIFNISIWPGVRSSSWTLHCKSMGGNIEILPNASVRRNSSRIMCF